MLLAGAGPTPRLAVLATAPSGTETTLHLVEAGAGSLPPPVARFEHAPWASVQAVTIGGAVLAVADREPSFDRSFASALVRLEPGRDPVWLAGDVVVASRPVPLPDGRLLVARGRAGTDSGDGSYRIDELTVDRVDAAGALRTLLSARGYLLYVAGVIGGEALIYRVLPGGADLLAVDTESGRTRVVVAGLPPYARDFTLEDGALVFLDRHATDTRRWQEWRVDPATGTHRIVGEGTRATRALSARSRVPLPAAPGLRLTVAGSVP